MNYAWEAALAADRGGIPRESLRYVPVEDGSPYTELVQEMLNGQEPGAGEAEVGINPLYRFAEICSPLFDRNLTEYRQTREAVFRVFMQYMVRLDLRQGMSRQEYAVGFLYRDILAGVFGQEASRVMESFDRGSLRHLMRLVLKLYRCGSSVRLFREVMRFLYPDSLVYASNDEIRELLIYVGVRETEKEQEKLEFLKDMFLPLNYRVFLFWEHHFGIIGVDETMELDNMVLY